MKVVVDTNVILDALAKREPWNNEADQIFIMAANQRIEAYITANSVTDIVMAIEPIEFLRKSDDGFSDAY